MGPNFKWKALFVLAVLVGSLWALFPTIRLAMMSPAEQAAMDPKAFSDLKAKAIALGLDLQGGMHLVLQVDKSKLSEKEAADAQERALEVIRSRIDQFGVTEPSIQPQGNDRIIVQLPGIQEIERAKELIGQTALLEFKLVQPVSTLQEALTKLDEGLLLKSKREGGDTTSTAAAATDTSAIDTLLAGATEEETDKDRPFSRYLGFIDRSDQANPLVLEENVPKVKAILADAMVQRLLPPGTEFAWAREVQTLDGEGYRGLYLVKKNPEMTGAAIQNAIVRIGLDRDNPNSPGVELTMSTKGRRSFAKVTGENVGRRLAIVLDGEVHTAPNIRERIPSGVASITGSFTDAEAKVLAIVLRAGALPAPIEILEERSVGPSLGKDSIDAGVKACWMGLGFVLLFMIFYYRLTGFVANIALVLNGVLLLASMVLIDATLTLPGIAGILLTLGMAVDANVLINERIREELRLSKTIRAAVEAGYSRAFRTIIDSHVTTMLTTFFLLFYGTASIKGFAVTLLIGLAISMFTAVFVTRVMMDFLIARFQVKSLSI